MSSRKDSRRCRSAIAAFSVAAALLPGGPAGAIPMPDPVGPVPLVGLLPRWTWDPSRRPPPPDARDARATDDQVEAALRFVAHLLTDQGEAVASVSGYRLDDPELVSVIAELAPRDQNGLRTTIALAFTVRSTVKSDGTYDTRLVVEDR